MLCATAWDGTITVWPFAEGAAGTATQLTGHTDVVRSATFMYDGALLATSSRDGSVRLWRTDTWQEVAQIAEEASGYWPQGIAFHPREPVLATFGSQDTMVRLWRLDPRALVATRGTRRAFYRNAKIVLLGDTTVGKTCLRRALMKEEFQESPASTFGRRVSSWHTETIEVDGDSETREVLLWDMAGQPGYRVVHQLHLRDIAVALILFDAREDRDSLAAPTYWHRALARAETRGFSKEANTQKVLVFSRADVQGPPVARDRIDKLLQDARAATFFSTSSKTGAGIEALATWIRAAIPWDKLVRLSSPDLFDELKSFLLDERSTGRFLQREEEIFDRFRAARPNVDHSRERFEACISLLEN